MVWCRYERRLQAPSKAQLLDYFAGEWVDQLDELKTNIDERQVLANAGAFALGRKNR